MAVAPVPAAVGARRRARERALCLLYEAESKQVEPGDVMAGLPVAPEPYAVELVDGVAGDATDIDGWLRRYARDWALERMPAVDRALLRIAVFELLRRPDVPTGVVLAEAVELASRYSTEDSARFVNGVLAAIAAEARPLTSA